MDVLPARLPDDERIGEPVALSDSALAAFHVIERVEAGPQASGDIRDKEGIEDIHLLSEAFSLPPGPFRVFSLGIDHEDRSRPAEQIRDDAGLPLAATRGADRHHMPARIVPEREAFRRFSEVDKCPHLSPSIWNVVILWPRIGHHAPD